MSNAPQSGYSIWATNSSLFLNNQENGSSLTSVTDYCNIDPFIFP